jgi:hypothetical protein
VIRNQEWLHFPAQPRDVLLPLPQVLRPRVVLPGPVDLRANAVE